LAVGDPDKLALEIEEAGVGLGLRRADEKLRFRERPEARLDLVIELAEGGEVDLERLKAMERRRAAVGRQIGVAACATRSASASISACS